MLHPHINLKCSLLRRSCAAAGCVSVYPSMHVNAAERKLYMQSWNSLTHLEALLLDHNALSGFLPSSWGGLEELEVLSLGMTVLTSAQQQT